MAQRQKKRLVVLTGAGISQQSGIPTFVEMGNLRDKLSRVFYNRHTQEFFDVIRYMKRICDAASPNEAHNSIAKFGVPVVTMNIDGLHGRAGSKTVCEIHGNLRDIDCSRCGKKYGYDVLEKGYHCMECGGLLNPDIVLYGDMIPRLAEALQIVSECDMLLIVGTSFYTSTATYVADAAKQSGAEVKIINEDAKSQVPACLKEILGE